MVTSTFAGVFKVRQGQSKTLFAPALALLLAACGGSSNGGNMGPPPPFEPPPPSEEPFWEQWGGNPQHTGSVAVVGQMLNRRLADIVYDPFVPDEVGYSGRNALLVHYQAPIVDGNDVYVMTKTGSYTGPNAWSTQIWNEARYSWVGGELMHIWTFETDWKPPPNGAALASWEPVFHPADANGFIYVPGAGGTLWKVDKATGKSTGQIDPFAGSVVVAANTFVVSPLSVTDDGSLYYNVIELADPAAGDPWAQPVGGSWLVKVEPNDVSSRVSYATLTPGAPAAGDTTCPGEFGAADPLPWPAAGGAMPASRLCGAQRAGVNAAPAIAPDGTIYTVSRAHFVGMAGYLVAANPDLTPKWAASLQHRFTDGCGVTIPIDPPGDPYQPGTCREGTTVGVDPRTNQPGSGIVTDLSTSSPVVLPDGSILYGAQTGYNARRGHLMHFDADGNYLDAYDFGWDITPAVWEHAGTWSIVLKDNHYGLGMYCTGSDPACLPTQEEYFITQLNADLDIEWRFRNTSDDGMHANGFEWCINQPAIDADGVVYANAEDGRVYALPQGNTGDFTEPMASLSLELAIGAAYTPLALSADGLLYTQNYGHLFAVGE
jgi:hypothetical protein